jgi:ribosomal protein L2
MRTFLRFDLGSLPANAVVRYVELSALAYDGYAWGGDGNVYTHFVSDDSWGETTVTWDNQPAADTEDSGYWWLWYDGTAIDHWGTNADEALVPLVQDEAEGDGLISFRLHSPGYDTNYRSREYATAAQRPQLVVGYLQSETVTLSPIADSYVSASAASTNYGTTEMLSVEAASHGEMRSFLRFDLSEIPAGAEIENVELGMLAYDGYAWGGDGNVYTRFVSDDTWGETTITWDNQPTADAEDSGHWWLWYDGTDADHWGLNTDPALAALVQTEVDGDGAISLRLHSPGYDTYYRSREFGTEAQRPYLVVTYVPNPTAMIELEPVADSYVNASATSTNYGTSAMLSVEAASHGEMRSFLRFDLGELPVGAEIQSVELAVMAYDGYAWGGDGNVYTRFVSDDTWEETTITWDNQPTADAEDFGHWWLWYDGTDVDHWGLNSDISLVPLIQGESDGDEAVSFRLHSPGYDTYYRSGEYATPAQRPRLRVYYSE